MPQKRKKRVLTPVDENEETMDPSEDNVHGNSKHQHGPMYTIMSNAQLNETFHNKYIREMQQLYMKMDHDAFMFTLIKMLKCAMATEETNEYAQTTLAFCAKFVASYDGEDTHPILTATFKWLMSTISNNPHIRFRLCQFVNMVLNALGLEAALDDTICDNILTYMISRLRDLNPNVRVQAILALQRLQVPDNPDDIVVKTYQFHLSSDPSPRVRQAVITSMGRNYNTIPYILERLWDVDEKVRRHTYLHMSSYPVKAYKVSQRLTFLEQGLNDRSDMVRKVVTTVMLPQWLESYNRNVIALISGLKLDANEAEIDRFRKITKMALFEIFKRQKKDDLVATLPLEEDGEYEKCVPFEKLTVEVTLFWLGLIEYLQHENADELDSIIPELTTFCNYVQKYCESSKSDMDKWQKMEYQYILLTLMEIVYTFDLGDEIGRDNLKILLETLLKNFDIEEQTIKVIVQCTENLITKQEDRLQFFVDIIKDLTDAKSLTNELSHDRTLIEELLEKHSEKDLKFQISSLKVKMLDLEEQETNFVQRKDYAQAQRIAEELTACREEYMNMLKPILKEVSSSDSEESRKFMSLTFQQKKLSPEIIIKSLQIAFYMVVSKNVKSLTPNVCDLYKDFIRRHVESNQIGVRDWALKCGTAYSMLYEPLSKDVYNTLYSQFYKNHNVRLWKTAIECIFELLDRYTCSHFDVEDKHNKSRKAGRQLYNTSTLDSIDAEEEPSTSAAHGVDLIFMMSHFLDTCDDTCILRALVVGFCRLVLHGHIKNDDIIEKLLLKYFNPITDPEINQILGVFFENLIKRKKHEHLQPCLLPTISTIMSAPYDSPLHEIKPDNVLRFVIDSTRPIHNSSGPNIHDNLALSFLREMQNNISNKELLKILAKELTTLSISASDESSSRDEMREGIAKLLQCDIDPKTAKYLVNFRDLLDGIYQPSLMSVRTTAGRPDGSDAENEEVSDDEDENRNLLENNEKDKETQANENGLETLAEETEAELNGGEVASNEKSLQETENNISSLPEVRNDTSQPEEQNEVNTENIVKTPAPKQSAPTEQQTPTTFGKDNTTKLRYLRKSMNVNRRSSEGVPPSKKQKFGNDENQPNTRTRRNVRNPPSPRKRRSESQDTNKSTHEMDNTTSNNEKSRKSETSKTSSNEQGDDSRAQDESHDAEKGPEAVSASESRLGNDASNKEKESSIRRSESSEELQPLVVSEDEVVESSKSDEEVEESSDEEDEVAASPEAVEVTTTRSRRKPAEKENASSLTQASRSSRNMRNSLGKSAGTTTTKAGSTAASEKESQKETRREGILKRRQRLFVSPETRKETPNKNSEKSQNNSKDKSPTNRNRASATDLTASAEKRIRTSKNPVLKVSRSIVSNNSPHQTRSASKQDFLLNTIITRKKLSSEKTPLRVSLQGKNAASGSLTKNQNNKENTIESGNKKSTSNERNSGATDRSKTQTPINKINSLTKEKSKTIEKSSNLVSKQNNENQSRSRAETRVGNSQKASTSVDRAMSRSQTRSTRQGSVKKYSGKIPILSTRLRVKK
ncbi:unnamed protein product [Hermetia illucens]|uniref:Nuclear condensin complex subunit 3 C-terminal domain-containing protein n=1 Tax=Hermetia illucens TaxID=343691 RepID=A0A7R8UAH7_HERIL|nr:condensin complex subunit 3 isoform X2 [Hermetia illucens]CAD7077192.1 unnamed protein product [Hermetia illucens]